MRTFGLFSSTSLLLMLHRMSKGTPVSDRSKVRRLPERGRYEKDVVNAVLDEGLVCHVALGGPDGPIVIPMGYARDGDSLLLHGSTASRLMQRLAAGEAACVCVTLLDAMVLARSVFHHSMNYRSVVVFGRGEAIEDAVAKRAALDRLVDHLVPGRSAHAREPNRKELNATLIVALPLTEASVKLREGPPGDAAADRELPFWGGLLPIETRAGVPEPDAINTVDLPEHVADWTPEGKRP
ncbi:MAG: pyridoxamine 5'-phosphate oxidase family protein [Pseudomonadota bacterium]